MRKSFLFILILITTKMVWAQSTLRPNNYLKDMNYYNIAAIPLPADEDRSVSLYSKYLLADDEVTWNKPPSFYLSYMGKTGANSFYSLGLINDVYSFYNRSSVYAGYTHRFQLGTHRSLHAGGRLVVDFDAINWDKLQLPASGNTGTSLRPGLDADLGIQYEHNNFTAGLATKNILASSKKVAGEELLLNQREIYLHTAYRIHIFKNNLHLTPYLLFRREVTYEMDAGLNVGLLNRVDVAYQIRLLGLRHIFNVNARLTKKMSLGLAYETSPLYTDKSVDMVLRYGF